MNLDLITEIEYLQNELQLENHRSLFIGDIFFLSMYILPTNLTKFISLYFEEKPLKLQW